MLRRKAPKVFQIGNHVVGVLRFANPFEQGRTRHLISPRQRPGPFDPRRYIPPTLRCDIDTGSARRRILLDPFPAQGQVFHVQVVSVG